MATYFHVLCFLLAPEEVLLVAEQVCEPPGPESAGHAVPGAAPRHQVPLVSAALRGGLELAHRPHHHPHRVPAGDQSHTTRALQFGH